VKNIAHHQTLNINKQQRCFTWCIIIYCKRDVRRLIKSTNFISGPILWCKIKHFLF